MREFNKARGVFYERMSEEGQRGRRQQERQDSARGRTLDELFPDLSETGNVPNPRGAASELIDAFLLKELKHQMIVQRLARVKAAKDTNENAREELKKGPPLEKSTDTGLVELNIDLATLQGMPEKDRKRAMRLLQFWKGTRGLEPRFIVPAVLAFEAGYPQEEQYTEAEVVKTMGEFGGIFETRIAQEVQRREKSEKDSEDFKWQILEKFLDHLFSPKQAAPAQRASAPWSVDDLAFVWDSLQIDAWLDQYSAGSEPDLHGFDKRMSDLIQRAKRFGHELYPRILTGVAGNISSLEETIETNGAVQRSKLLLLENFALHLPEAEFAMLIEHCKDHVKKLLQKTRADLDSGGNEVVSKPQSQ